MKRILLMPDPAEGGTLLGKEGAPPQGGTPPAGDPWYKSLPESYHKDAQIIKFKSVEELAKGYKSAESLIGAKRIALPGDKSTPEERAAFFNAIGRPEAPDKYKAPTIEGVQMDGEKLKKFQAFAHEAGLTNQQFESVLSYYGTSIKELGASEQASREAAQSEATNSLKQAWGDKFDRNLDVARSTLKKFGSPELIRQIDESGFGNNPEFIKALSKIGENFMEDDATGRGSGVLDVMDETRAKTAIEQLKLDKDFQVAFNDGSHAGHRAAVERWSELHKRAYPGKQRED